MKRAEEPKRIADVPARIGPFFYIKNTLIYNACPLSEGRQQADKVDNSYGHE